MIGGLVGTLDHEATHAAMAWAFHALVGVGWQGGLAGGPYVDYQTESRWRSEAIRKAPLVLGTIAAVLLVATYDAPTVSWVGAAGAVAGLLWSSPEDLFIERARASVN